MTKLLNKSIHKLIIKKSWSLIIVLFLCLNKSIFVPRNFDIINITSNGIFTMSPSGSLPAFHYEGKHNRTYIGYYSSDAKVKIVSFDEETHFVSKPVTLFKSWGNGDDHAGPSVLVLSHQVGKNSIHNGKILVASSEIFDDPSMMVIRSSSPENITKWEDPITFDKNGLYPTLFEMNDGTIFLFYMKRDVPDKGDRAQCYKTSTDGGITWSDRHILFLPSDSWIIYGIYASNSTDSQIHAMFNLAKFIPEFDSWYKDIYYAYYDHQTETWKRANGIEYSMPITIAEAELVYETDMTQGEEDHTWLSDIKVDVNNKPHLLSITNVNYSKTGHTPGINPNFKGIVQLHTYQNGTWKTELVSENGSGQFGDYAYPAMAIFDPIDLNTIYLTPYNIYNKTDVEVWHKDYDNWQRINILTTNKEGYSFRPQSVRNSEKLKILWCYTTNYQHHRGKMWVSEIFGYID